jgi:putative transposase
MKRTYKYRLCPNHAQDKALDFLLWQGRNLHNAALEQRIKVYQGTGKGISYPEQWAHFRDERNANPETLGKLNATSVQQMLRRLDKSFSAFFRRLKAGEKPGFPRFKGRNRFHSLEYRHGDGCRLRTDGKGQTLFYIQNVGQIKVKYHRPIPNLSEIKHVILKRSLDEWYVCLSLDMPDPEPVIHDGPAVGVDVGLKGLLALSDGTTVDNPRWMRGNLRKLRVAQRRLSRRKKGSNRRRKAARQVARLYERITNQRRDFWHKTTRRMVDTYGLIAIEGLTLNFLTQNSHLSLSAHDAGLGEFRQLLDYKAEEAGSQVVTVNPRNTSQVCSGCGKVVPKKLSVRIHACPACGLIEDRDVNAARNILKLALSEARTGPSGANVDAVRSCVA